MASVRRPPCSKPHVAGRRTDETGDRMLFHVLAHVEAHEGHFQKIGERLGKLGLAHARGAVEQKRRRRPVFPAQARAGNAEWRAPRRPRPDPDRRPGRADRRRASADAPFRRGSRFGRECPPIRATTRSMSCTDTPAPRRNPGFRVAAAPASSMTSMALSGRSLS